MITYNHLLVEEARRQREMALAEEHRLIRQVARHNPTTRRNYQRWLAQLGTRLVAWGRYLQTRYDNTLAMSKSVQPENV